MDKTVIFEILALGWLACLFVNRYLTLTWQRNKSTGNKPFNCQMCMGFWTGLAFFGMRLTFFKDFDTAITVLTYSLLTSLAATIEYAVIKKI